MVFNAPDRMTLDRLSAETGYIRDVLEKVYRLFALLGDVRRTPDLLGMVALKGGTALQSIHLGFRRLLRWLRCLRFCFSPLLLLLLDLLIRDLGLLCGSRLWFFIGIF